MAAGISISIASDTRSYAAGVQRGVIEPTEDAAKALDDLARNDAGADIERGMRTAQRGTVELKSDLEALKAQVAQTGRTGTKSGADFKAGMHEADEGVKSLKENTASNLKEVAASFDGTTSGAIGGVQGLAAEFLEGFGPGGLIAGAIVAGGIGLLGTAIEDDATKTDAFKADVQALTTSLIESGKQGRLSTGQIADGLKQLAANTDTSKASLADVESQAKSLGIPFKELAHIYAEGGDATQYALNKIAERIRAEKSLEVVSRTAARGGIGAGAQINALAEQHIAQLESQRGKLVNVQKETAEAAKREQEWLKAGGPDLEAKAAATEVYATGVQDALKQAGSSWDDYADKEGGLDLDKYIKVTQAKQRAVQQYENNLGRLAHMGSQAALNYIESLGTDAAPLLDKFVKAPASKQRQLVAIWDGLGKKASSGFKSALEDGLPDVWPTPALLPPDSKAYKRAVREAQREAQQYLRDHPLRAGAVAYTVNGKPIY